MLGLGSNLISGVYVEGAAATPTIGLNASLLVASINDENVVAAQTLTAIDVTGVSNLARVAGLEANATIVHTHGEDEADITDVSETLTLYAYKFAGSNSVFLSENASGSFSNPYSLNLTAINSGSIAAVGEDNKYTIRVNYFSKAGFNNSAATTTADLTTSAA